MTFSLPIIIGAFSGALLPASLVKLSPRQRILYAAGGTVGGTLLTPILAWSRDVPIEFHSGLAFGVGVTLMIALVKFIKAKSITVPIIDTKINLE